MRFFLVLFLLSVETKKNKFILRMKLFSKGRDILRKKQNDKICFKSRKQWVFRSLLRPLLGPRFFVGSNSQIIFIVYIFNLENSLMYFCHILEEL